ncbi:hypothetical protein O181_127247, partial [Austropuccinia psidii MF-1]|nr:hypothetical protein [Austropuccinia psidii MF-1]
LETGTNGMEYHTAQNASNAAYHPYARSALPTCLRHRLPSLRLYSALPTCLRRCFPSSRLQCPPNMPLTPLTILTLAVTSRHASDAPYHPYARSNLPTCLRRHFPSLCLYSAFPTCLRCHLPSLRSYSALLTCLQRCLPSLCSQCPPNMPQTPPSHWPVLTLLQPAQDETTMPPPSPPSPPPFLLCRFQFLHSRGTLKICLRRHPQPLLHLILSLLLTILMLRY